MFRSPDYNRAKQRARDGWESTNQKQRVTDWLRQRGAATPTSATEGWELVVGMICEDIKYQGD